MCCESVRIPDFATESKLTNTTYLQQVIQFINHSDTDFFLSKLNKF